MSVRASMARSPVACSGDMYCGVPSESPVCVIRAPPAFEIANAMPKSATSGWPSCNENILGLEIAVDDALAVRVVERRGDRGRDSDCFVDRELLFTIEPRAERFAFDERHDVEQQVARGARIEQRQKIRMLEIGGDLNFRLKAIDADYRTEIGAEHLERDLSIVPEIAGEIDLRHAAFADEAFNGVSTLEGSRESVGREHAPGRAGRGRESRSKVAHQAVLRHGAVHPPRHILHACER